MSVARTILVTGAAGYIGSVVAEQLVERGDTVFAVDNLSTGHAGALHPKARFLPVDLGNRESVDLVFRAYRFDAVIHMAAKSLIPESIADPAPFYTANIVGGLNLINAMVAHGVKPIIFSSSAATYGETDRFPIDETTPTCPMNPYGESKLAFENILRWYGQAYGLETTAFRYFSAAGASAEYGERHVPETHLIPLVLQAAAEGRPTNVYGDDYPTSDGTCIRDFIHVIDLAAAHIRALDVPNPEKFRVFNLGSGTGYSVLEVIRVAEMVTGKSIARNFAPRRAGDPAKLVATTEKAIRELDWRPRYQSLAEIIDTAWRWRQAHPQGYVH